MDQVQKVSEKDVQTYVKAIMEALEEKRAADIETLHVAQLTSLADYFVVCTGNSTTHIRTLSEEVEHLMETKYGIRPHHIEGYGTANWVLVDYGFLVVHIFHRDARQFYSLERLWSDAPKSSTQEGESNEV